MFMMSLWVNLRTHNRGSTLGCGKLVWTGVLESANSVFTLSKSLELPALALGVDLTFFSRPVFNKVSRVAFSSAVKSSDDHRFCIQYLYLQWVGHTECFVLGCNCS